MNFDLYPISPARRPSVSGAKYWMQLELPGELINLNMQQLTALRKMVMKAYEAGRRSK